MRAIPLPRVGNQVFVYEARRDGCENGPMPAIVVAVDAPPGADGSHAVVNVWAFSDSGVHFHPVVSYGGVGAAGDLCWRWPLRRKRLLARRRMAP